MMPTQDELRAAAERIIVGWRAYYPGDDKERNEEQDALYVAEAWLAEHPADDDEPVTKDWLTSVGWDKHDSCNWPCISLRVNGVAPWEYAAIVWRGAGVWLLPFNVALCLAMTRGDVRRLCTALGIELASESRESQPDE